MIKIRWLKNRIILNSIFLKHQHLASPQDLDADPPPQSEPSSKHTLLSFSKNQITNKKYHFYTSFMSVKVQKMTAPTLPKVNRDLRCRGDFKILNNNVEWCVSEDKDSRCFRWNSAHSLSSREFTSKTSEVLLSTPRIFIHYFTWGTSSLVFTFHLKRHLRYSMSDAKLLKWIFRLLSQCAGCHCQGKLLIHPGSSEPHSEIIQSKILTFRDWLLRWPERTTSWGWGFTF